MIDFVNLIALKFVKMADFALLETQKLISRKICDRKIMKIPHCVMFITMYVALNVTKAHCKHWVLKCIFSILKSHWKIFSKSTLTFDKKKWWFDKKVNICVQCYFTKYFSSDSVFHTDFQHTTCLVHLEKFSAKLLSCHFIFLFLSSKS